MQLLPLPFQRTAAGRVVLLLRWAAGRSTPYTLHPEPMTPGLGRGCGPASRSPEPWMRSPRRATGPWRPFPGSNRSPGIGPPVPSKFFGGRGPVHEPDPFKHHPSPPTITAGPIARPEGVQSFAHETHGSLRCPGDLLHPAGGYRVFNAQSLLQMTETQRPMATTEVVQRASTWSKRSHPIT